MTYANDDLRMDKTLQTERSFLCDTKYRLLHRRQPLKPMCNSLRIDNEAVMLNGLLHSKSYEGRRVTRRLEVLSTTLHSSLDEKRNCKSLFRNALLSKEPRFFAYLNPRLSISLNLKLRKIS
ncbi:hypothetical protein TNCV_1553191 [Trichonephila clavipes]|nr:hypothetical protein TNCV_1553191 [Trichonephila clavipes]